MSYAHVRQQLPVKARLKCASADGTNAVAMRSTIITSVSHDRADCAFPSIQFRENPHNQWDLLAPWPHRSRVPAIRPREDIQRQFGRSVASSACPSRSPLSARDSQRGARPNHCGRGYRESRARRPPREFASRPCPRTYGGAVDEWLTCAAGIAPHSHQNPCTGTWIPTTLSSTTITYSVAMATSRMMRTPKMGEIRGRSIRAQ